MRKAEQETDVHPSESQKKSGNYRKGRVRIDGLNVSIEQPKGSVRSGVDENGKSWSITMNHTYGYIGGTKGKDGDNIDVFLSDNLDGWTGTVYVIDQVNDKGDFDEHKVMYGFNSQEEARKAYLSNYEDGWQGLGSITPVSKEGFKGWLQSSRRKTKAFAQYKGVKGNADADYQRDDAWEAEQVNKAFNEQLRGLTEENKDRVVLSLGVPGAVLRSAGVSPKPMKLYGNKVIKKMKKHGFTLDSLTDLPRAVANPIAVFNNMGRAGNRSILTELKTEQGNFLVTLDLGKDADVDFNVVSSVFGKGKSNIVGWINSGYATYINKEKARKFLLHNFAPIANASANNELVSATKIIESFDNPPISAENDVRYRRVEADMSETERIVSEAKANGTYMLAPNGKATNLNERQWVQVRTQAFKEWFGDWENDPENSSKVVGANGEPLVVYHGTRAEFTTFSMDKIGSATHRKTDGFYFSTDRDYSRGFGDVMDVFLNLRKPFSGFNNISKEEKEYLYHTEGVWSAVLNSAGFDGIDDGMVKVAFSPEQIKSATDNVGTFDGGNNDIRFQVGSDALPDADAMRDELDRRLGGKATQDENGVVERKKWNRSVWIEHHVDRLFPLKVLQDLVAEANGIEVSDFDNAYMQGTHVAGKIDAEYQEFSKSIFEPMLDAMAEVARKAGINQRMLENYLMCKHGLERNATMRAEERAVLDEMLADKRIGQERYDERVLQLDNKDYSGLTAILQELDGKTIDEFIAEVEARAGDSLIADMWNKANAVSHFSLNRQMQSGMLSRERYGLIQSKGWKYYVPLRGHSDMTAEKNWEYASGAEVFMSRPVEHKANGRVTRAESPITFMKQMAHTAIKNGVENEHKQAFYRFALKDKTGMLTTSTAWYERSNTEVDDAGRPVWYAVSAPAFDTKEEYEQWEEEMERKANEPNANVRKGRGGLNVGMFIEKRTKANHAVSVWIGGELRYVYVNGNPRPAQALMGTNMVRTEVLQKYVAPVTRWMARLNTTRNPAFMALLRP